MKKLIAITIVAVALSGCATHGQYIERMEAHKSLHKDTVVRSFGLPDRVHKLANGGEYYQWIDGQSGSISVPISFGNQYAPPMYSNIPYHYGCSTIFEFDEWGYSRGYTWSGNGCVWYEPATRKELEELEIPTG